MNRWIGLFTAVLLVSLITVSGTVAAQFSPTTGSASGSSVAMEPDTEQQYLNQQSQYVSSLPTEAKSNAFWLYEDGETYVVFTDEEPQTGSADVSGYQIPSQSDNTVSLIFAESAEFQTAGEPTPLSALTSNPDQFHRQHVRVSGNARLLSYALDESSSIRQPTSAGVLQRSDNGGRLVTQPGRDGRWSVMNLSGADYGVDRTTEIERRVFSGTGDWAAVTDSKPSFWKRGPAAIDAVVDASGSDPVLIVADVTMESESLSGPAEIANRGDELAGGVVSFETQAVGARTSTKQALISAAKCAPSSITNPITGCFPVVTDSTIHSGVLFDGVPESRTDVVPYTAMSNVEVGGVSEPETGTYEVTGRVVASDQLGSGLPEGYALVVYDMERAGKLSAQSEAEDTAKGYADSITEEFRSQLTANRSEWQKQASLSTAQRGDSGQDSPQQQQTTAASSDGSNAQSSNSEGSRGSGQNTKSASIEIVDSRTVNNPKLSYYGPYVQVWLENSGGEDGSITIDVTANGEPITSRTVEVGANSKEEIMIVPELPSRGKYTIKVNGERAGVITSGNVPPLPPTVINTGKWVYAAGILLTLFGIVVEIMRYVKFRRGGKVTTTSKQIYSLYVGGAVVMVLGGWVMGHLIFLITAVFWGGVGALAGIYVGFKSLYRMV